MRTITFSFTDTTIEPIEPQYAGIQGEHHATQVVFWLPREWSKAGYQVRAEFVDGTGAFDTTEFLEQQHDIITELDSVTVPLPVAWTVAGGLAEIRLVAATLSAAGLPEEIVAYSPVGYLYFDSRTGEPAAWREFPNRGLSSLIADTRSAIARIDDATADLQTRLENGEFDGTTWRFGTQVTGTWSHITASVSGSKVGDLYLNTATDDVYVQTDTDTWERIGCLRGAVGATGAAGADGYGVLPVYLATTTTGDNNHIYEVYLGTKYTELPPAFIFGFYASYGITKADKVWLYGNRLLWQGDTSNITPLPLEAGYHLFQYEDGKMREIAAKGDKGDTGHAARWWSGAEIDGNDSSLPLPTPRWANGSAPLVVQYDGRPCMRFGAGVVTEIAYNGGQLAELFGLAATQPVDVAITVDYYWKKADEWPWWHFRTTNADGSYTHDNGYGTLPVEYGMIPNRWDTVTVRRTGQVLGYEGRDDWYINVQNLGNGGYLYIRGITFTATEADGTVHRAVWGEPLLTGAVEGDMYLNTETGEVYRRQADRWQYQMVLKGDKGESGDLTAGIGTIDCGTF